MTNIPGFLHEPSRTVASLMLKHGEGAKFIKEQLALQACAVPADETCDFIGMEPDADRDSFATTAQFQREEGNVIEWRTEILHPKQHRAHLVIETSLRLRLQGVLRVKLRQAVIFEQRREPHTEHHDMWELYVYEHPGAKLDCGGIYAALSTPENAFLSQFGGLLPSSDPEGELHFSTLILAERATIVVAAATRLLAA